MDTHITLQIESQSKMTEFTCVFSIIVCLFYHFFFSTHRNSVLTNTQKKNHLVISRGFFKSDFAHVHIFFKYHFVICWDQFNIYLFLSYSVKFLFSIYFVQKVIAPSNYRICVQFTECNEHGNCFHIEHTNKTRYLMKEELLI